MFPPVRLAIRLALSLSGLVGAFGTAALLGMFLDKVPEVSWALLLGLACGSWIAIRLYMRVRPSQA